MTTSECACGEAGKYKCPGCRAPSCSLICSKTHANACNQPRVPPPEPTPAQQAELSEYSHKSVGSKSDTVSPEELKLLESSRTVTEKLKSSNLRETLKLIRNSDNPAADLHLALENTEFQNFAQDCLFAIDGGEKTDSLLANTTEPREPLELFQNLLQSEFQRS